MGFRKHPTLKCHTCKRRQALSSSKKNNAEKSGWVFKKSKKSDYVWLCPACSKKKI